MLSFGSFSLWNKTQDRSDLVRPPTLGITTGLDLALGSFGPRNNYNKNLKKVDTELVKLLQKHSNTADTEDFTTYKQF